jgi:hypothetical protein
MFLVDSVHVDRQLDGVFDELGYVRSFMLYFDRQSYVVDEVFLFDTIKGNYCKEFLME